MCMPRSKRISERPKWKGYQMALGDEDGDLDIHVTKRDHELVLTRDELRLRSLGYPHLLTSPTSCAPNGFQSADWTPFSRGHQGRKDARVYLKCDTRVRPEGRGRARESLRSIMALQIDVVDQAYFRRRAGLLGGARTDGGVRV